MATDRTTDDRGETRPAMTAGRFSRSGGRHRFTARRARVVDAEQVSPVMVRVRVTGPDFADFVSTGPADHMRVFFPDPQTGELNAPAPAGPGEEGILRPEGPTFARDFTPLRVVDTPDGVAVDVDLFLHPSFGPAAAWAAGVRMGQELVIVGPRGSRGAPQDAARLLLVVDETALPSATRWIAEVPTTTSVDVVALTADDGGWAADYLAETSGRADARVHLLSTPTADPALLELVSRIGIDAGSFVFGAGEASGLAALRRHLRRELGLSREQVALSGYWKRGTAGFDHHAPIDPTDTED